MSYTFVCRPTDGHKAIYKYRICFCVSYNVGTYSALSEAIRRARWNIVWKNWREKSKSRLVKSKRRPTKSNICWSSGTTDWSLAFTRISWTGNVRKMKIVQIKILKTVPRAAVSCSNPSRMPIVIIYNNPTRLRHVIICLARWQTIYSSLRRILSLTICKHNTLHVRAHVSNISYIVVEDEVQSCQRVIKNKLVCIWNTTTIIIWSFFESVYRNAERVQMYNLFATCPVHTHSVARTNKRTLWMIAIIKHIYKNII